MVLEVGDNAPDFVLAASTEEDIALKGLAGKAVVLYFYPKDDTPGCTKEACGFRYAAEDLQALGAVVLGVGPDNPRILRTSPRFRLGRVGKLDLLATCLEVP